MPKNGENRKKNFFPGGLRASGTKKRAQYWVQNGQTQSREKIEQAVLPVGASNSHSDTKFCFKEYGHFEALYDFIFWTGSLTIEGGLLGGKIGARKRGPVTHGGNVKFGFLDNVPGGSI